MSDTKNDVVYEINFRSVNGSPLLWALHQLCGFFLVLIAFFSAHDAISNSIFPSTQNITLCTVFLSFIVFLRTFKRSIAILKNKLVVGDSIGQFATFYKEIPISSSSQLFRRRLGRWVSIEIVNQEHFSVLTHLKINSLEEVLFINHLKSFRDTGDNHSEDQ